MSLRHTILVGVSGAVVGALTILAIRFATYHQDLVHYHANFAVYLNGQRQGFGDPLYYLDGSCTVSSIKTPERRAHLVRGINGVVHVQDDAVTWGQFFENLGWYVGDDFIKTDGPLYITTGNTTLHIILNGQDYTGLGGITNTVIKDRDRLLLSYGNESQQAIRAQYRAIPATARQYDGMKSTAACGHTASVTVKDRLHHLF